jgi:hypothetical protein
MYASVTQAKSTLDFSGPEGWILVYGWSDLIESSGKSLAPGNKKQDTYYLADTFPVVDMVTNTTRSVRLQGNLRILVGYEQKISKRKIERHQQKDMTRAASTTEGESSGGSNCRAVLEIQIPCPSGAASSDCLSPPPVYPGEHDQWTQLPGAQLL